MNKYLKSAVERYNKEFNKELLIHPISEIDVEIITELVQILKKSGRSDILELMKSYKELKDEEIRDQLLQWNIDHPANKVITTENKEEEPIKYPPMIQIGDSVLKINFLYGFDLYENTDSNGSVKFGIILNPTPDHVKQVPYYANHKIEWFSEEDRNNVLDRLKFLLAERGTDFIDLLENE